MSAIITESAFETGISICAILEWSYEEENLRCSVTCNKGSRPTRSGYRDKESGSEQLPYASAGGGKRRYCLLALECAATKNDGRNDTGRESLEQKSI